MTKPTDLYNGELAYIRRCGVKALLYLRQPMVGGSIMFCGRPFVRPLTFISRDAISLYLVEGLQWNLIVTSCGWALLKRFSRSNIKVTTKWTIIMEAYIWRYGVDGDLLSLRHQYEKRREALCFPSVRCPSVTPINGSYLRHDLKTRHISKTVRDTGIGCELFSCRKSYCYRRWRPWMTLNRVWRLFCVISPKAVYFSNRSELR